jgi:hypothetical protein
LAEKELNMAKEAASNTQNQKL